MKKIFTIISVLLTFIVNAQTYPLISTPDSLFVKADAILHYKEIVIKQSDINNATEKHTYAITVLNNAGREYADIIIPQDIFMELKSLSGKVINTKTGKEIKKISKSDLITSAYSSSMASDNKYSVYEYQPPVYPFTIVYEYEIKYKNGIFGYPVLAPVLGYDLAVQEAKYTLQIPADLKIRYKAFNMSEEPKITRGKDKFVTYEWTVGNVQAITHEAFAPTLSSITPRLNIAPEKFCMEGYCGDMTNWNMLGSWVMNLQEGRTSIPQDLKNKLLEMTKDAKSDKEKVDIVYKYLQSTTRYVNMNLGIGGFQSTTAESVAKNGFGDCKALSNYMKSMLDAIDIPSVYVLISTVMKNIYTDFASLNQMNHVILAVPQASDTIWLECTSSILPFNYAQSSIAGHQALLITPDGGKLCTVRPFPEIGDNKSASYSFTLNENGNITGGKVSEEHKLEAYEDMLYFANYMSREEQINHLAKSSNMSKVKISNLQIVSNDSEYPNLQVNYDMDIERYANKSGNRLFVPLSPIEVKIGALLKQEKRKHDIVVKAGMVRTDTLNINIPANYSPEAMPKSVSLDSQFGKYTMSVIKGNNLQIIQQLYLKQGCYPASTYEDFRQFFKQIEKESKQMAVFKLTN